MGQAHLKSIDEVIGFTSGQLSGEFANGGVSEIDNAQNGEVLSMEDFLKAEENLEHAPSSIHEIEEAAVTATTHLEQKLEQTTFLYSQKETGREQNGGVADENTVTEIGRLKVGIQDEADRRKKEEKRNQYRALDLAIQQAHDMEHLQAEINRLNQEIEDLRNENKNLENDIKVAEEQLKALDEIEEALSDLDSDDPSKRRSARSKIDAFARQNNIDPNDPERNSKIKDLVDDKRDSLTKDIDSTRDTVSKNDDKIAEKEGKIKGIIRKIENPNDMTEKSTYIAKNADNNAEDSAFDEDNAFDNAEDRAFDNVADNAFDTAFDDIDLYGSDNEQSEIEINEIAQLEDFNANKTIGSFSGSGEETASVITAQFAAKADVNQPATEVNPDLQQNNQITPATINGLG